MQRYLQFSNETETKTIVTFRINSSMVNKPFSRHALDSTNTNHIYLKSGCLCTSKIMLGIFFFEVTNTYIFETTYIISFGLVKTEKIINISFTNCVLTLGSFTLSRTRDIDS